MTVKNIEIAPSLMCMDLTKFKEQIKSLDKITSFYHVDIMDGHYVNNMTLSPWFIEQLNKQTNVPIEAHLMVTNPENYVDVLLNLNVDLISFHAEHLIGKAFRLHDMIKDKGSNFGVVLNPETPLVSIMDYIDKVDVVTVMTVDPGFAGQNFIRESLNKVKQLAEYKVKNKSNFTIQIDGSCNEKTYKLLTDAGAERLVLGSSGLFDLSDEIDDAINIMENQLASII